MKKLPLLQALQTHDLTSKKKATKACSYSFSSKIIPICITVLFLNFFLQGRDLVDKAKRKKRTKTHQAKAPKKEREGRGLRPAEAAGGKQICL